MMQEKNYSRYRLLSYYSKLINARGIELNDSQEATLKSLVNNMMEDAAQKKISKIEEQRRIRLMAYAEAFKSLTKEEEQMADALLEVIDATEEDPEQEAVIVNGNKFLYEKGSLDIKKYIDKLSEIGKEQKGQTWSIYVDDEGELVIY